MQIARSIAISIFAGVMIGGAVGCQGRASLPANTEQVRTGSGRLSYTATDTGNVYVLDEDQNKKVFEGQMKAGDQIVVEPDQDRIVLAGNDAPHNTALTANHRYSINFQKP